MCAEKKQISNVLRLCGEIGEIQANQVKGLRHDSNGVGVCVQVQGSVGRHRFL